MAGVPQSSLSPEPAIELPDDPIPALYFMRDEVEAAYLQIIHLKGIVAKFARTLQEVERRGRAALLHAQRCEYSSLSAAFMLLSMQSLVRDAAIGQVEAGEEAARAALRAGWSVGMTQVGDWLTYCLSIMTNKTTPTKTDREQQENGTSGGAGTGGRSGVANGRATVADPINGAFPRVGEQGTKTRARSASDSSAVSSVTTGNQRGKSLSPRLGLDSPSPIYPIDQQLPNELEVHKGENDSKRPHGVYDLKDVRKVGIKGLDSILNSRKFPATMPVYPVGDPDDHFGQRHPLTFQYHTPNHGNRNGSALDDIAIPTEHILPSTELALWMERSAVLRADIVRKDARLYEQRQEIKTLNAQVNQLFGQVQQLKSLLTSAFRRATTLSPSSQFSQFHSIEGLGSSSWHSTP